MALYGAYGLYAAIALQGPAAAAGELTAETIPGVAVFLLAYFVLSRALQYYTLLVRDKLFPEERALILRYEVIVFVASSGVVLVILLTIANVGRMGWLILALALLFAGMLWRILEEAVAAEELTRIHAMDLVVSADASIDESFRRIAAFANRLVNWSDFRILRLADGARGCSAPARTAGAPARSRTGPERIHRAVLTGAKPW